MPGEPFPEGRLLTIRIEPDPAALNYCIWTLHDSDPDVGELARSSRTYLDEAGAEQAARDIFGGWLGSVIGIDLERADGARERLR